MGGLCVGSAGLPRVKSGGRPSDEAVREDRIRDRAVRDPGARADAAGRTGITRRARRAACRACCCARCWPAICLLPPTILMGASLPAVARWIEGDVGRAFAGGLLYGANTDRRGGRLPAGRVLPASACHDMQIATFVAGGAECRGRAGQTVDRGTAPERSRRSRPRRGARDWPMYVAIGALGRDRARRGGHLDAADGDCCSASTVYTSRSSWRCSCPASAIGSAVGSAIARSLRSRAGARGASACASSC